MLLLALPISQLPHVVINKAENETSSSLRLEKVSYESALRTSIIEEREYTFGEGMNCILSMSW